jgi:hypothetical protein
LLPAPFSCRPPWPGPSFPSGRRVSLTTTSHRPRLRPAPPITPSLTPVTIAGFHPRATSLTPAAAVHRPISIEHHTAGLLTGIDGSGTRANRSDHRNHNNAIFDSRWLPKRAFTITPPTTTQLADASQPSVQWALQWDWLQRYGCADSTVCVLQHTPAASGEQVRVGTHPPGLPAGP